MPLMDRKVIDVSSLSLFLPTCLSSMHLPIYRSIYLPIYLSICPSTYLSIFLSFWRSIYLSLSRSLSLSLSLSLFYLSSCLPVDLFIYVSIYCISLIHVISVCNYVSIYLSIYLPIARFIYLLIGLSFSPPHHSTTSRRRVSRMVPAQPFFPCRFGEKYFEALLPRM